MSIMHTSRFFASPHRTLQLVATSGAGKSLFTSYLAAPNASFILRQCVGETNSTIAPRTVIFSDDPAYANTITVAVKRKSSLFSSFQLTSEILIPSLAETARTLRPNNLTEQKMREVLAEKLTEQFAVKNNLHAVLTLLNQERISYIRDSIVQWATLIQFHTLATELYGKAVNRIQSLGEKAKRNSEKLLTELKTEIGTEVDNMVKYEGQKIQPLQDLCKEIEENLSTIFFSWFSEDNYSDDHYYFRDITLPETLSNLQQLSASDFDFVTVFFNNNSLADGTLSLEILCQEILIYVPIHKTICSRLVNNTLFADSRNHHSIAILDTQGIYHANATDDESREYCHDLMYQPRADATVLLIPLSGDSNIKKALRQFRNIIKTYRKDIPIIPIFNKADLFLDDQKKQLEDTYDLMGDIHREPSCADLEQALRKKADECFNEMLSGISRPKQLYDPCICYLRGQSSFPESLRQKYSLFQSLTRSIDALVNSLKNTSGKVKFHLDSWENDPVVCIDDPKLCSIIRDAIDSPIADQKVFAPAKINIIENRHKTPHGNSYNALRRRLQRGEGYNGIIDENYFYNCQSIYVTFPGNLQSFLSPDLRSTLIETVVSIRGGKFDSEEDATKYCTFVNYFLSSNPFVARLLYENAMLKAESLPGSFGKTFQRFIAECENYLIKSELTQQTNDGVSHYVQVLSDMLKDAAYKALQMYTQYQ